MPGVDRVEHGLADAMGAQGEHLEVVFVQQGAAFRAVVVLLQRSLDLEMIAPAGQFEAVVAEAAELTGQFGQRQIAPLAGENCYRSRHG